MDKHVIHSPDLKLSDASSSIGKSNCLKQTEGEGRGERGEGPGPICITFTLAEMT